MPDRTFGQKTYGELVLEEAYRQHRWRQRRRTIYMLLAITAVAALIKIAVWGI